MKPHLIPSVALFALIAGCATLSEPDITRISLAVREAATLATQEALQDQPRWRPAFVTVSSELNSLSTRTNVTVLDLVNALNRLPLSEMKSDTARLSIAGARLLIALAGWSDVEVVQTTQVIPVIVALRDGIQAGLELVPETPATARLAAPRKKHAPKYYKLKPSN